ncbi:Vascular endothelial growth factor receptor 3-like protein [Dinothrombium tinctorium]|uniref:Vascular endothelial growth factor receptor 3-like protein n=1 Tax=Dinothrombium tinctorium TaxID=1965070 RepID=A0A443RN15_9ACAR|nr:Vascular endothelial growth factor receptor 3-like protein [Dinothrombium tinctorium]
MLLLFAKKEIKLGDDLTYDPTSGFNFRNPFWEFYETHLICKVVLGEESQEAYVIVYSSFDTELFPSINDEEAKNTFVNGSFSLTCIVNKNEGGLITIYWIYPVKDNSRVIIDKQNLQKLDSGLESVSRRLTVKNLKKEDSGVYNCVVVDTKGKKYNASKIIQVEQIGMNTSFVNLSPELDTSKPLILDVDSEAKFAVFVDVFPPMTPVKLLWFKDGIKIADANGTQYYSRYKTTFERGKAILNIEKITMEDIGFYTLEGSTADLVTSISIKLIVRGPPMVKIENFTQYYLVNKEYSLPCIAIAYPTASVWWEWLSCENGPSECISNSKSEWSNPFDNKTANNELIASDLDNYGNRTIFQSVLNFTAHETGVYRCKAQNLNGTVKKDHLIIINDFGEKAFSMRSSTDEAVEMSNITLTCEASSFNYSDLFWSFQDQNLSIFHLKDKFSNFLIKNSSTSYSIRSEVYLNRISKANNGRYFCNATPRSKTIEADHVEFLSLNVTQAEAPKIIRTNMKGQVITAAQSTGNRFDCFVSGRPKPKVIWYKNNQILNITGISGVDFEKNDQQLNFRRLVVTDSGRYKCEAKNFLNSAFAEASLKVINDESALAPAKVVGIVIFCIFGVVFFVMALYLGKRIREERKQKREIALINQKLFDYGQIEMFNPDMPLDEQIELLPYDPSWEFPRERLKLGRTLGQGAFGRVVKAEAIGIEEDKASTTVAVKMLKERCDLDQRRALMAELKILIHIGKHVNIVNLLGSVAKDVARGELLVIVEYCRFGNLRQFLLKNRVNFINQIDPETGKIDSDITEPKAQKEQMEANHEYKNVANVNVNPAYRSEKIGVEYVNLINSQSSESTDEAYATDSYNSSSISSGFRSVKFNRNNSSQKSRNNRFVTTCDLICFCFQVARGMEYLERRKDCYKYDNYVKKSDGPLPIKWMAIESIRDKIFTSKSDVWSFGVLIWELFTLGGNPYPGVEINEEFYKRLRDGYRMEKPDLCPDIVYSIIRSCWQAEPLERPDFAELVDTLGKLLESSIRQHYIELNDPYEQMNLVLTKKSNDYIQMMKAQRSSQQSDAYLNMGSNINSNAQMNQDAYVFK